MVPSKWVSIDSTDKLCLKSFMIKSLEQNSDIPVTTCWTRANQIFLSSLLAGSVVWGGVDYVQNALDGEPKSVIHGPFYPFDKDDLK